MGKKQFSVMLVPDDGGLVKSFRVPRGLVPGLIAGAASVLLLTLGSIFVLAQGWQTRQDAARVAAENQRLLAHLSVQAAQLETVVELVGQSEQMERQARLLAGLDPVDAETRQMGVGGPLFTTGGELVVDEDQDGVGGSMRDQSGQLDALVRRVAFQRQSYKETLEILESQKDRLDRTPTISPIRTHYAITSGYGWRSDPFTGQRTFHHGIDMRAPRGTPVMATAAGEVLKVGRRGDLGLVVTIGHGDGVSTQYSHLDAVEAEQGQTVVRGDVIGTLGSSGRSTGPHVHYEVQVNGVTKNPRKYILTSEASVD